MENHVVLKTLLFSTPEVLISIIMTHGFLGKKMEFKKWILISLVMSVCLYFIRTNMDSFILYTIINISMYVIVGIIINRAYAFKWTISILLSKSIYSIIEFIFIRSLILIFNINPLDFSKNIILALKCFIPQIVVVSLIAIVIYDKEITVFIDNR